MTGHGSVVFTIFYVILPIFLFLIAVLELLGLNSTQDKKQKLSPNVQKSDQHRKKNCAVEKCNAVVFRMTDFCHRHQNETPTPPNTIESDDTNSKSQNWWEPEESPDLPDTISTDTPQRSPSIPIMILGGLFFLGPAALVPVIGYFLYTAFTKRDS